MVFHHGCPGWLLLVKVKDPPGKQDSAGQLEIDDERFDPRCFLNAKRVGKVRLTGLRLRPNEISLHLGAANDLKAAILVCEGRGLLDPHLYARQRFAAGFIAHHTVNGPWRSGYIIEIGALELPWNLVAWPSYYWKGRICDR